MDEVSLWVTQWWQRRGILRLKGEVRGGYFYAYRDGIQHAIKLRWCHAEIEPAVKQVLGWLGAKIGRGIKSLERMKQRRAEFLAMLEKR